MLSITGPGETDANYRSRRASQSLTTTLKSIYIQVYLPSPLLLRLSLYINYLGLKAVGGGLYRVSGNRVLGLLLGQQSRSKTKFFTSLVSLLPRSPRTPNYRYSPTSILRIYSRSNSSLLTFLYTSRITTSSLRFFLIY